MKIVDVKCPDSGEGGTFRMENLNHLTPRDEVKFVISSRGDYEFARDFIREHELDAKGSVILSPAFRKDAPGSATCRIACSIRRIWREWMLADDVNARLGLQIHKFIWEPQVKGV